MARVNDAISVSFGLVEQPAARERASVRVYTGRDVPKPSFG